MAVVGINLSNIGIYVTLVAEGGLMEVAAGL